MNTRDFYDKRLADDPAIGSVQLMEEYAKHIIEIHFCDGSSLNFDQQTIEQLKKQHHNICLCIDWVNS